jgi:hypothetical protein
MFSSSVIGDIQQQNNEYNTNIQAMVVMRPATNTLHPSLYRHITLADLLLSRLGVMLICYLEAL